jgi:preprotein translocase subunit SecF
MQAEQADMALANTLDTLRATGAGAGGATALAQAALQSKKDISASIEQQEAANEKLRAQGEMERNQMKMAEQQRLQSIKISEAQRVQGAEAAGQQFMFGAREDRTNADLGQQAGQYAQAQQNQASANAAQASAWGSAIGGVGSALGGLAGGLGKTTASGATE